MTYSPDWTTQEVADFLETLGLGSYHDVFIENDINGECLPLLNEDHLKDLQMKSIGHRITFMQYLQSIKRPTKSPIRKTAQRDNQYDQIPQKRTPTRQYDNEEPTESRKSQPYDDDQQDRSSKSQTPTYDDSDDNHGSGSSWEKKRRAAVMKRMNNESGKRHIQQPEMNFGTNDDNGGLFGAPPPVKGRKQTDYGDDYEDKQPFKANPNPFSREDADLDYPPPRPKAKATKKASNPAPKPSRRPEPEPEPEPSFPAHEERDDDYFAQFGEDDVPPMGGSKLGGPGARNNNMNNNSYEPKPKQRDSFEPKRQAPPPRDPYEEDDRVECSICHRKFAADRIDKHMQACKTAASRKKKVFDSAKMRNADNDAIKYQGRSETPPKPKKSNYKEQHEQLVANLKAARAATEYEKLKAEGKAVGPPPKMPEYQLPNDDRVTCPYCGRKFGSDAAERHIPFCEKSHAGKKLNDKGNKPGTKRGGRW